MAEIPADFRHDNQMMQVSIARLEQHYADVNVKLGQLFSAVFAINGHKSLKEEISDVQRDLKHFEFRLSSAVTQMQDLIQSNENVMQIRMKEYDRIIATSRGLVIKLCSSLLLLGIIGLFTMQYRIQSIESNVNKVLAPLTAPLSKK